MVGDQACDWGLEGEEEDQLRVKACAVVERTSWKDLEPEQKQAGEV